MKTACERTNLPGRSLLDDSARDIRASLDAHLMEFHPSLFDGRCGGCGVPCDMPRLVLSGQRPLLVCGECFEIAS